MLNHIRSDESLQVLLFVVLPLLLLLGTAIFLRIRYTPPSTAQFPNFSVTFSSVGREDSYVIYQDSVRRLEFYAGPGSRKQLLCLAMPNELPDDIIREIVPRLEVGLTKLRFHNYKILKEGESKVIASSQPAASGVEQ